MYGLEAVMNNTTFSSKCGDPLPIDGCYELVSGGESSDVVVRLKILWTIDSCIYTKHCRARTTM